MNKPVTVPEAIVSMHDDISAFNARLIDVVLVDAEHSPIVTHTYDSVAFQKILKLAAEQLNGGKIYEKH